MSKQTTQPRHSILLLALLPVFGQAYADDTAATVQNTAVLPEIEVSGDRGSGLNQGYGTAGTYSPLGIPMSLRETPQSVSVITQQQIKDQHLESLADVFKQANGLSTQRFANNSSTYGYVYARGYTVDSFLMDGVPFDGKGLGGTRSMGWGNVGSGKFERVEVLRGASALLGGTGEPSAQISLVRKRPTKTFQGMAGISAGSWKSVGLEGDFSGSLNRAGTLRGRMVVSHDSNGLQLDDARLRSSSLYAVAEYDLTPQTMLTAGIDVQKDKEKATSFYSLPLYDDEGYTLPLNRSSNPAFDWSHTRFENKSAFASLEHRFNPDWQGKLEYNYSAGKMNGYLGYIGYGHEETGISHNDRKADVYRTTYAARPIQHSFAAVLNGHYGLLSRRHQVMFGISGFQNTTDYPYQDEFADDQYSLDRFLADRVYPNRGFGYPADLSFKSKDRKIGAYAATRFHATDKLALIGGARYTRHKTFYQSSGSAANEASRGRLTPYIGAVWDFSSNLSLYGSYGTTFLPSGRLDRNGRLLKPEQGRNLELGLKGEFFDGRLNASATLFETRKTNHPQYRGKIRGREYYIPRDYKTRGFEAEISGEINRNWAINAGLSIQKSRQFDGKPFATEHPTRQLKLSGSYHNDKLTLGGSLRWTNRIYSDNTDLLNSTAQDNPAAVERALRANRQGSYALVDLMAAYRFNRRLEAQFNVNNVLDKKYRTTARFAAYGDGRNVNLALRYRF